MTPNNNPDKTCIVESESSRHLTTALTHKEIINNKITIEKIKKKLISGEITASTAIKLASTKGLEENTELLDYIGKWYVNQEQQRYIADSVLVEIAMKGSEDKDRIQAAKILRGEQAPGVQFNQQINVHKDKEKDTEKDVREIYADIPVTNIDWSTSKDTEDKNE